MGTKLLRILILSGIFLTSIYASCKKGLGCANEPYVFETGIRALPENDSIPVNDTVWFSINQNTRMTDLVTGSQVDFSNAANLSFVFGIRAVISPAEVLPAADSFNYVVRKGQHSTPLHPDYLREYKLSEENSYYKLEVGFVAKKKGVYRVLVENSANVFIHRDPCKRATINISFLNADPHFYLGYTTPAAGPQVYYFKVY